MINLENQKEGLRPYFEDRLIKVNLFSSLMLNIIIWGILFLQVNNLSKEIPLHYNIYFGIDLFGPWYQLFVLPLLGVGFLLLNFFLGAVYFSKEKIISYFLAGASSLIQILLIIATLAILSINL